MPFVSKEYNLHEIPSGIRDLFASKPPGPQTIGELVSAVESVPRFGPTAHGGCIGSALAPLGIGCQVVQGAFWHQILTEAMRAKMDEGFKYVLCLDFDTIFTAEDVKTLFDIMEANYDYDAVSSLQMGREKMRPLFVVANENDLCRCVTREELTRDTLKICTSNFALTMIRCESLQKCGRPWFLPCPSPDGWWGDGRIDADIHFWHKWKEAGLTLYQANRVVVGHLEMVVSWPDKNLNTTYQSWNEYATRGQPCNSLNWKPRRIIGGNEEIKLDIGCGDTPVDGYEPVDHRNGEEAYPLDYPDSSVVEIRASHVLEHFSHLETEAVLLDWVRVLKPGGKIKIAVPDLNKIMWMWSTGDPSWQSVLMGGQDYPDNFHKAAFYRASLEDLMQKVGLTNIQPWASDREGDCSGLAVSLNLEGVKP